MMSAVVRGRSYCVVCLIASVALATIVALLNYGGEVRAQESKPDPAVDRARAQVKMIDSLYKTAVVSITNRYDGPPAIKVAKDVFEAMKKEGWHDAKLVDASGEPQNEANLPQTEFEKRAAEVIKSGKPYYEEVSGSGTNRVFNAATVVPAVVKKCATCHGMEVGDLLGFIRYELPIK